LHLYNTGFKYWESGEEIQKRREINQKYTRPNLIRELLLKLFKVPSKDEVLLKYENAKFYTCSDITRDIILYFGSNHKDITAIKVGKELSKLDLVTKRKDGYKMYLLVKKDEFERNKDQAFELVESEVEPENEKYDDLELPF
ncbi:MAG: hypothetical protein H6Q15_1683, partial [Bacteroidetes bacterium]|nr:hypothetical protein [Bacteroidota bacterium]